MTIYISGPITGHLDYGKRFGEAAARLTAAGHTIYNPAAHTLHPGANAYGDYMRRDLEVILERATGLALLPGWHDSEGAFTEWKVAKAIGLPTRSVEAWELTPPTPTTDTEGQALVAAILDRKTKKQPTTNTHHPNPVTTKQRETNPPHCAHTWTNVDTLPPIKECAQCGETRIIHT